MIGMGLKKLAEQNAMTVNAGVAYGSLKGYATTLSEGSGWKRIDISTMIPELERREQLQVALNAVDLTRTYRVQNLEIGQRIISVIFLDNLGTMKKIEEFIEWFYPLLSQSGAVGADTCLECGAVAPDSWYLIDGVAHHLHETCAEKIRGAFDQEQLQREEEDTGTYAKGFLGAFLGAMLGAVVWALVLYAGYVASIVGLVIGWLAEKGYTLLHGKQGKGKLAILIVVIILAVILGTLIPDAVALADMINTGELPGFVYGDIPMLILVVMLEDSAYMSATLGNMAMGLLFAGLGAFALLKKTGKEVSGTKMKKLS